ncbi:MAG: permease of phosphate ABC transporter [Clostridia bacterium]|nr:permease of phosphate ABC transporter [Clostridia bacterium]
MMKLFDAANQYLRESDWKTLTAIKFCLFSMGVIVGLLLPQSQRAPLIAIFSVIFIATYIPLMRKLFLIFKRM